MSNKKKKFKKIVRLITKSILYLIAVGGGILSAINIFVPFFREEQLSMLLLIVCILLPILASIDESSEVMVESIVGLENSISNIENSLQTVDLKCFDDSIPDEQLMTEVDKYIADRISNAKSTVYDFVWQYKTEDARPFIDRSKFVEAELDRRIKEFCSVEKHSYFELLVVSTPHRYNKMINHLKYGNRYACKVIDYNNEIMKTNFPRLQFVLIDKEEVIFASNQYGRNICAFKSKKLGAILAKYFESAWGHSSTITIKDIAKKVEKNNLFMIRDLLKTFIVEINNNRNIDENKTKELLSDIDDYNSDIQKLKCGEK